MDDNVHDHIKNKLDEASPEELGYRPDRGQMWNRINPAPAKRSLPFLRWTTHAAAVAAGLLLGFFLWTGSKEKPAPAVAQQQPQPATPVIRDTVYLAAAPATTLPAAAKVTEPKATPHKAAVLPAQAPATTAQEQKQAQDNIAVHPQTQEPPHQEAPLIAHASEAPIRPAVLHLADIGNENARSGRKPKMPALFNIIPIYADPADLSETLTMSVTETLFKPRN